MTVSNGFNFKESGLCVRIGDRYETTTSEFITNYLTDWLRDFIIMPLISTHLTQSHRSAHRSVFLLKVLIPPHDDAFSI